MAAFTTRRSRRQSTRSPSPYSPIVISAGAATGSFVGTGLLFAFRRFVKRNDHPTHQHRQEAPVSHRSIMSFDKGNAALVLDIVRDLSYDSPAAATAIVDIMTQQQSPYQPDARSRLTRLLQTHYPHAEAIRSSEIAIREAEESGDGQLTALLGRYELEFLTLIHRSSHRRHHDHRTELESLINRLSELIEILATRNSQRRQASALAIKADLCVRLAQIVSDSLTRDSLTQEARRASGCAMVFWGGLHKSPKLIELSKEVNGPTIVDEAFRSSSDQTARHHAETLVGQVQ